MLYATSNALFTAYSVSVFPSFPLCKVVQISFRTSYFMISILPSFALLIVVQIIPLNFSICSRYFIHEHNSEAFFDSTSLSLYAIRNKSARGIDSWIAMCVYVSP